jgi:hypothetical protein
MAETTCSACGVTIDPFAPACPSCGAGLGPEPIDVEIDDDTAAVVVSAEPPATTGAAGAPTSKTLVVATLAVVASLALIFAIGGRSASEDTDSEDAPPRATDPPSATEPPSTTDPSPSAQASGAPIDATTADGSGDITATSTGGLEWQASLDVGELWPLDFVQHEGDTYVFAIPASHSWIRETGLWAWRTRDGVRWDALGQVLDHGAMVNAVGIGPRGFAAVGTDEAGDAIVWRSSDALDWRRDPLPTIDDRAGVPVGIVTGSTVDVVVASDGRDGTLDEIHEALQELFEDGLPVDMQVGVVYDGTTVRLTGPLGFTLAETTYDELGVSAPDPSRDAVSQVRLWVFTDDLGWRAVTLDPEDALAAAALPDGSVYLDFPGDERHGLDAIDGLRWGPDDDLAPMWVDGWAGGLVARSTADRPGLRISDDGDRWQNVWLDGLVPWTDNVNMGAIEGRAEGIATTMYPVGEQGVRQEATITAVLIEDGYELVGRAENHYPYSLTLERDGEVLLELRRGEQPDGRYRVDLAAGSVVFLDPDSGDELIDFAFDELQRFEARLNPSFVEPAVVIASADAVHWSVDHLDRIMGDDREHHPAASVVVGGRVFVTVLTPTGSGVGFRAEVVSAELATPG